MINYETVIQMSKSNRDATMICYFLLSALLLNLFFPILDGVKSSKGEKSLVLTQDTVRPEISSWNFSLEAKRGEDFEAWAEVSDRDSGVRNVSLVVNPSSADRIKHPLGFNGSLYISEIPALQMNRTYNLFIQAFDKANNSATSYSRSIDLRILTTTQVDPHITFLPVVLSSSVVAVIVILLACFYDRRMSGT